MKGAKQGRVFASELKEGRKEKGERGGYIILKQSKDESLQERRLQQFHPKDQSGVAMKDSLR